jgi:hypothetical protein
VSELSRWFREEVYAMKTDNAPQPDIAQCSQCGGSWPIDELETEEDGDWESGYYQVHICPVCEDGGCIDDYFMSKECAKEWREWAKRRDNAKLPKEEK